MNSVEKLLSNICDFWYPHKLILVSGCIYASCKKTPLICVMMHVWVRNPSNSFTSSGDYQKCAARPRCIDTLRPRQNGRLFPDTFWIGFSWMKMYEFRLEFHWGLFLLTIFQHWFRKWLGTDQATSHYLNQSWLVYRRIYASLGPNELMERGIQQ